MTATVCHVAFLTRHPDADRLVLLELSNGVTVVTGDHYEEGQRGIYIAPYSTIPGYLAEDLWMLGKGNTNQWVDIGERVVRGINSPGTFAGAKWRTEPGKPWNTTWYFRDRWKDGDDVSDFLGILEY